MLEWEWRQKPPAKNKCKNAKKRKPEALNHDGAVESEGACSE